jgi:hypothetical protein
MVRLAFVASLMAAPAAFAAMPAAPMDVPPAPAASAGGQSMATPMPGPMDQAPMNQSMATPAPTDQTAAPGAPHTDLVTNGPQGDPGDHARNWSAARNVRDSQRYDRLVATSPGFRHARERKECGPITDPGLRSQCMASFDQGAEAHMYGSSQPPHPIRNSSGASE